MKKKIAITTLLSMLFCVQGYSLTPHPSSLTSYPSPLTSKSKAHALPVIPGYHPDPSVCRLGNDYYLVNSSFQYFPGVPIFKSSDMRHWTQIGNVLDRESQLPLAGASSWLGIYAPTIRYNDGLFYMITTNVGGKGNFLVTAERPEGPWSEPVWLSQQGIDPSLYFEDGKCYMVSNPDNTITLCEIDPTTGRLLTESRGIWQGTGGRYPEGPHIYKKDGYYYLLISEGGTEIAHKLTIARSRNIYGPYESNPANPIFTHCCMAAQGSQVQGTGHGDLVEDANGQWWITFLAFRFYNGSYHHLGRETFLAPVEWSAEGWPIVNGGEPLQEVKGEVNDLPSVDILNTAAKGFGQMGTEWVYIQNPDSTKYEHRGKVLRLHGSSSTLTENNRPTFVGRRQQHADMTVRVGIDASQLKPGDEAGLTAYQIHDGHCEVLVGRAADGKFYATVRYRMKNLEKTEEKVWLDSSKQQLVLRATPELYEFLCGKDDKSLKSLGSIAPQLMSTEVVGGFTGIVLGIYATGSGSADFHYFDYKF